MEVIGREGAYIMSCVDLNCDLGESFGTYTIGLDAQVIPHVSSVNIACGYHAGDPVVMEKTVALAREHGVAIGAHPGFPDLMGFGRRPMNITPAEAGAYVKYQMGALLAFVKAQGLKLQHVKPHGALYNMAAKDVISEVFADRAYNDDGSLVNRKLPGAVIHDAQQAAARAVMMAKEHKIISINGKEISLQADSICVHGDNAQAIELVCTIRSALKTEGIAIKNFLV